jgi:N4-gp56 family major capsid protein
MVRTVAMAGTSIIYANGAAESAVTAGMTGALVRSAVDSLRKADVPTFDDGYYHALLTTEQASAIRAETLATGFNEVAKYANPGIILRGEIGTYGGAKFFEAGGAGMVDTSSTAGGSVDIHYGFITGPEAYGVCGLDQLEATYVAPRPSASDPLGLIAYMGWHLDGWGAKLLVQAGARYRIIKTAQTTV